ncbi:MAG: Ig-like domain-containing protein [Nitrosopumilaceae archaeon]
MNEIPFFQISAILICVTSLITVTYADATSNAFVPTNQFMIGKLIAGKTTNHIRNIVDLMPPTISITFPANNTSVNTDTFQITGNSSSSMIIPFVRWNIDNLSASTTTGITNWSFTASLLSDGIHTIRVNAIDVAGNVASQSIKVTVDTKPPVLTITGPAEDMVLGHIYSINGTASDNNAISSITAFVDDYDAQDATYSKGSWTVPVDLPAGMHVVTAVATDTAGNSVTSRGVYFMLLNPILPTEPHIPYAQTSPIYIQNNETQVDNNSNTQNGGSSQNSNSQNNNSHSSNSHSSNSHSHSSNSHSSGNSSHSNSHSR